MWINLLAGIIVILMFYLMYKKIRHKFSRGLVKIPELSSFVETKEEEVSPSPPELLKTDPPHEPEIQPI